MSKRRTSGGMGSATSLPGLEPGVTRLERLDGQTILPFGQAVVPVRVSVQPGRGEASQIDVTYGPHGTGSSESYVLSMYLASRLRARTVLLGSTLFQLVWKERVTPSGRVIPALRASGRRTSGSDCTSWLTPCAQEDNKSVKGHLAMKRQMGERDGTGANRTAITSLKVTAKLTAWPTPQSHDERERGNTEADHHYRSHDLSNAATLAGLVTPEGRDWKDTAGMELVGMNPDGTERSRVDQLPRQARLVVSGRAPGGSNAPTAKRGQLNPALSRWLMGLPSIWDLCALTAIQAMKARKRDCLSTPRSSSRAKGELGVSAATVTRSSRRRPRRSSGRT